ncbi:J domain-containing protein [Halobaculum sp. MBLA0147]|uniref:J domain-containing protein n=1 Tax=Halobaculum sp. MBLA0147 TaxID=3079934 RepID=UPI003526960B
MDRDTLVLGIAAVFAGTFVTMSVLALTYSWFLLFVAVPFGIAAYFLWYQVSGDLEERFRGRRADPAAAERRRAAAARKSAAEGATGGESRFAEEARRAAREARRRRAEGAGVAGEGRVGGRGRGRGPGQSRGPGGAAGRRGGGPGGRGPGTIGSQGMPPAEAYDALDVERGASQERIKEAYRERVKEVHPDSGGDEEAFKRVNEAYETLKTE